MIDKRKFDQSLITSTLYCKFNHAQLVVCRPLSEKLRPFPTTFWLTCPHLVKLAGRIESQGGVKDIELYMRKRKLYHEWNKYNFLHQSIRLSLLDENLCRFMRKYHSKIFRALMRSGIGGMVYGRDDINVKCLHLQTASFLGLGFHPAEEWLRAEGLCRENYCRTGGKCLCAEF